LLALAPAGRRLRDGVHAALVGPPNVGKSSLFNALLGEERVLVDAEAGTTRDEVTATLRYGGLTFVLHDTAGLRAGGGRVERAGMQRTLASLRTADIIVILFEAAGEAETAVLQTEAIDRWRGDLEGAGAAVIQAVTKADRIAPGRRAGLSPGRPFPDAPTVITSSKKGLGIPELKKRLSEAAQEERIKEAVALGVLLNDRHQDRLEVCRAELDELIAQVVSRYPGDEVVASLLAATLSLFGEVSGRVYSENLLGSIFARFCVGK
jgi:tRNA modification GTPase